MASEPNCRRREGDEWEDASEFVEEWAEEQWDFQNDGDWDIDEETPEPPPQFAAPAAAVIDSYNKAENAVVRQTIVDEANGKQTRGQKLAPIRASRAQRRAQVDANMTAAVGQPLLPPGARAMPWADGSHCETVSLRYKFKKRQVWVYPPLPRDVGATEAANQAQCACRCAKQVQNLPCYNGSAKIATGKAELIMP